MGLFSSEPSSIERKVIKATDENLTTEDWSLIIEVCDDVNAKPSKNGPLAVEALRKRLTIPNGNVQLFSLTLLNALAQNTGPSVQREIASTPVTGALSALGTNPSTHRTVVARLIEILGQISDQFSKDPSLNQVEMAYDRVISANPSLARQAGIDKTSSSRSGGKSATNQSGSSTNTGSNSRSKPSSAPVDDDDDEDLRRALELSLKDMGNPLAEVQQQPAPKRNRVRALYDFTATEDGELTFRVGDVIEVIDRVYKEWWKGVLDGREGIFPVNYVEPVSPEGESQQQQSANPQYDAATSQDAQQQSSNAAFAMAGHPVAAADMNEEYIFSQGPAVEKLLTILASASDSNDGGSIIGNTDLQQLYHHVASMRPKLMQLIDEYTIKKQELVDLNQKLLQARRSYEQLISDASQHRYLAQQGTGVSSYSQGPQARWVQPQQTPSWESYTPSQATPQQVYAPSQPSPQQAYAPPSQAAPQQTYAYPQTHPQTHPQAPHPQAPQPQAQTQQAPMQPQTPQTPVPQAQVPTPQAPPTPQPSQAPPQPSQPQYQYQQPQQPQVPPQQYTYTSQPQYAPQSASAPGTMQGYPPASEYIQPTNTAPPHPSAPAASTPSVASSSYTPVAGTYTSSPGYKLPYPDDRQRANTSVTPLPYTNGIVSSPSGNQ